MIRRKLASIAGDPQKISIGYALGIFLGTTPFVGCKVFIALLLTSLFRWSKLSAVFGVYHINLFTAPLFYTASFFAGKTLLGTEFTFVYPQEATFSEIFHFFYGNAPIFYCLMAGGLLLGIPMALGAYWLALTITRKGGLKTVKESTDTPGRFLPVHSSSYVAAEKPYTLITGASSGLGKEFAIDCAKRGMNLILVALPGRNLQLLCDILEQQYGIRAISCEADLTQKEAIEKMITGVLEKCRINFLINNAGTGGTVEFDHSSTDYLERIIQLNITAVALLTRLLIPELKRHPVSHILNVSSMAAFSPIPYKTIYPASKAFIYNFSRSLNQELKGTGIRVAVVHPGPILTNPDVVIRIVRQGSAGKVGLLQAAEIARRGIEGVMEGKSVIIPGIMNKLNRFLMSVVPATIRLNTLSRVIHREIVKERPLAA